MASVTLVFGNRLFFGGKMYNKNEMVMVSDEVLATIRNSEWSDRFVFTSDAPAAPVVAKAGLAPAKKGGVKVVPKRVTPSGDDLLDTGAAAVALNKALGGDDGDIDEVVEV